MSAFEVMRRASLGVFGAVALACAGAPGGAFALSRAVGGIHVDVAPSRENAGDPTAAWVAQAMPGALAQALGKSAGPAPPSPSGSITSSWGRTPATPEDRPARLRTRWSGW
jgi:hypothetical protein